MKQKTEKPTCVHQFQFSHSATEARGQPAIYMRIWYVICTKCGELREQTVIPRLEEDKQ